MDGVKASGERLGSTLDTPHPQPLWEPGHRTPPNPEHPHLPLNLQAPQVDVGVPPLSQVNPSSGDQLPSYQWGRGLEEKVPAWSLCPQALPSQEAF